MDETTECVTERRLFCTGQRLSLLRVRTDVRPYLSGERFWDERNLDGERKPKPVWGGVKRSAVVANLLAGGKYRRLAVVYAAGFGKSTNLEWGGVKRSAVVANLLAGGKYRRLAVVCAAGFGKSTNMEWLEVKLWYAGQVAFRFVLDDTSLPDNPDEFWARTLPLQLQKAKKNSTRTIKQLVTELERKRKAGKITLLLDSVDQATANALLLVRGLLETGDWDVCPIVVSARPHAVFDHWDQLIKPDESAWRFLRVEPLASKQRVTLLGPDGVDLDARRKEGIRRYRQLPESGRALLGNPRNVEYVRKLAAEPDPGKRPEPLKLKDFRLRDLRTASHLFAGAADHAVRYGMTNPAARKLGRRKDRPAPEVASEKQIQFALDLLGALAFAMYCQQALGTKKADGFRPNVSRVPADEMPDLLDGVLKKLKKAKLVDRDYDAGDLDDDLEALAELNTAVNFDLIDTRPKRHGDFRWHDRTLQEFFAAWWLSRHASDKDIERLRRCRYDDTRDATAKSLFAPLWGFLVEMPRAVRKETVWCRAVGVIFEHDVGRYCEMIFHAWPALMRSRLGRKVIVGWRQEFEKLLRDPGPKGDAAREIRDPARIRRCPKDPMDDRKPFMMGSPLDDPDRSNDEVSHPVIVSPFEMHDFPVTNTQFELFDPLHADERWEGKSRHPLVVKGELANDDGCPAVNVAWFQAWAFAHWVGYRLPTEAEWEYACRAGTDTAFAVGPTLKAAHANFDWKIGATTPRGRFPPNSWELFDLHGNVREWCQDWFGKYRDQDEPVVDPTGAKGGSSRVYRGGCWFNSASPCRSACRSGDGPGGRFRGLGFRLAAVPVGPQAGPV